MDAARKMPYHVPHREQNGSKWLTATLISLYMLIAVLAILYSVDNSSSKRNRERPTDVSSSAQASPGPANRFK